MNYKAIILHSEVHKDWSGAPMRVLDEAAGMVQRGYKMIIAAPPDSKLITHAVRERIYTQPLIMKKWISFPYSFLKACNIIITNKVDIVNTHASYDSWIFSLAAKMLGRKLIRTRHISSDFGTDSATRFIYRLPDCIITCSGEHGRKKIIDHFHLDPENVISVPSSPDLKKFDPDTITPENSFGIANGDTVIGMVSAFRRMKGHIFLIESIPEILKNMKGSIKFLIVGNGHPSLKDTLVKRASDLGVIDKCIFPGYRTDIPEMLALMDIFVLPSLSEGTPQVLQQAMAMKLPIISCPVGGILDLFGYDSPPDFEQSRYRVTPYGILVPPGNPSAIADAVTYLLQRPDLCEEIGKRNRLRTLEKYSRDIMLDKIENIYVRLLSSAHRRDTSG